MVPIGFLAFLPLVNDLMIRQLGDEDFQKREAASRYLSNVLEHTDGCENYSTLLKVKQAQRHSDTETRRRAQLLYQTASPHYFQEHSYFCIYWSQTLIGVDTNREARKKIDRVTQGCRAVCWGRCREGVVSVFVTPKDFNSDQLTRLKAHKEVTRIVPIDNPDQAWGPGVRRNPKRKE